MLPLFHPWKSQISMDLPIWSFNITKSHNTWHLASGTAFFYFFQGSSMWYMYLHFIPFHSRSIYPLAWYSILHLSSHQLIDMWVVPTFWLLWIMLLWTFIYKFLYKSYVFSLWGIRLGVESLGHVVICFKLLRNDMLLSAAVVPLYGPTGGVSAMSTAPPALSVLCLAVSSHSRACEVVSHRPIDLHFPED